MTTKAAHRLTTALTKRAIDGTATPAVATFAHGTRRLITAHLAAVPACDREQVAREALAAIVGAFAVTVDQLTSVGGEK